MLSDGKCENQRQLNTWHSKLDTVRTLTPDERKALRARAHALHPVVMIGNPGLTDAVLKEIDIALKSHELIKIRMLGDDRAARGEALERICSALDAAPEQLLGKVLVIYRPRPEPEEKPRKAPTEKSSRKRETRRRPPAGRSR